MSAENHKIPTADAGGAGPGGLYRLPSPGRPHPPEAEALAAAALHHRASRLRRLAILPCIAMGIAGGIAGYFMVRAIQIASMGGHMPLISGVLGTAPPLALAMTMAQWLSSALVRRRKPVWIVELSGAHGVPVEVLSEYADML